MPGANAEAAGGTTAARPAGDGEGAAVPGATAEAAGGTTAARPAGDGEGAAVPGATAEAAGGTTAARPVGDAGGAAGSPTSDNAKAAAGLGAARAVATVVAGTMPPAGSAGTAVVASVLGAIRTSAESAEVEVLPTDPKCTPTLMRPSTCQ